MMDFSNNLFAVVLGVLILFAVVVSIAELAGKLAN